MKETWFEHLFFAGGRCGMCNSWILRLPPIQTLLGQSIWSENASSRPERFVKI